MSKDQVVWGVRAIAQAIGRDPRATSYLLRKGLPGARKIGGQWAFRPSSFFTHLGHMA